VENRYKLRQLWLARTWPEEKHCRSWLYNVSDDESEKIIGELPRPAGHVHDTTTIQLPHELRELTLLILVPLNYAVLLNLFYE